jgi:hypothetical protein
LRKREEKSYVESPDMIFERDNVAAAANATNGDVDMVSETEDNENEIFEDDDDDSDDGKPLPPLPSPKVSSRIPSLAGPVRATRT